MLGLKLHQRARSLGQGRHLHTSEVGLTRFHPCHCNLIINPDETALPTSKHKRQVKPARAGASRQTRRFVPHCGLLHGVSAPSQGSERRGDAIPGTPIAPTQPWLSPLLGAGRHKSVLLTAPGQEPSQGAAIGIGALPSPTGSVPPPWLQPLGGCPRPRRRLLAQPGGGHSAVLSAIIVVIA